MTPSVTEILVDAGLIDTRWFSDEVRTSGEHVHTICQLYDEGDLDEDSVAPEYQGYLDGYCRFLRDFRPVRWNHVEQTLEDSTHRYHGTLDRLGSVSGTTNVLLDIKTGVPFAWHQIQLAAYANMLPIKDRFLVERWGLYLSKDGAYKVAIYGVKEYQIDNHVFHAALTLYEWRHAHA